MKYHTSYRMQKRRRINDICAKMRAGKERKRLEQISPEYPAERPEKCMQIIVADYECSEPQAVTYTLQACAHRRDTYWIWEGQIRLPKPMGRAQFFRKILTAKHPRLMPL